MCTPSWKCVQISFICILVQCRDPGNQTLHKPSFMPSLALSATIDWQNKTLV